MSGGTLDFATTTNISNQNMKKYISLAYVSFIFNLKTQSQIFTQKYILVKKITLSYKCKTNEDSNILQKTHSSNKVDYINHWMFNVLTRPVYNWLETRKKTLSLNL